MNQPNHSEAAPIIEALTKWEHVGVFYDEHEEELERNEAGDFRLVSSHNGETISTRNLTHEDAVQWAHHRMIPECLRGNAQAAPRPSTTERKLDAAEKLRDALEGVNTWITSPDTSFHALKALHLKCSTAIRLWDEANQQP